MNTDSTSDARLDDLADRIGRCATARLFFLEDESRELVAIGGSMAVSATLGAVQDFFDARARGAPLETFGDFIEGVRDAVALLEEEMAA